MLQMNMTSYDLLFLMVMSSSLIRLLEIYIIINFKTYKISRNTRKLTRTFILIK